MNCQEALNLLYDIIDDEASEIDVRGVEEHLSHCHDCAEVYKIERSVSGLIQERLRHKKPTPRFHALKSKVLRQLDEVDTEGCD